MRPPQRWLLDSIRRSEREALNPYVGKGIRIDGVDRLDLGPEDAQRRLLLLKHV